MINNYVFDIKNFYEQTILAYIESLYQNPFQFVMLILDVAIVLFLAVKLLKIVKDSRAWQLLKGIVFLMIATGISSFLGLKILNYILNSVMTYGALVIIVIFQPELRRALELSKTKTGALIVLERDIQIKDIISTGIIIDAEVSPQLLVNIFVPNTPLHDGAVVISNNKIEAAACMLPLAGDKDIAKELGTRHRAAIGISKESDAIVVVVSEETGKISVAKDGTLIADVNEEALKKILITNIVTKRFPENKKGEKKQDKE